jgi:hypothetical protein
MRSLAIGFCAVALSAAGAMAQQSPAALPGAESPAAVVGAQSPTGEIVATPLAAGPTIESAAAGFRVSADKNAPLTAAAQVRRGQGRDVALMAVGVGAMVVGAIVGGDAGTIILVGGAAMALFGLYNYLE